MLFYAPCSYFCYAPTGGWTLTFRSPSCDVDHDVWTRQVTSMLCIIYIYIYKYVYMCTWVSIILRENRTLLFQKLCYLCRVCVISFSYWQDFGSAKDIVWQGNVSSVLWNEQKKKKNLFCTVFFFVCLGHLLLIITSLAMKNMWTFVSHKLGHGWRKEKAPALSFRCLRYCCGTLALFIFLFKKLPREMVHFQGNCAFRPNVWTPLFFF